MRAAETRQPCQAGPAAREGGLGGKHQGGDPRDFGEPTDLPERGDKHCLTPRSLSRAQGTSCCRAETKCVDGVRRQQGWSQRCIFLSFSLHSQRGWLHARGTGVSPGLWALSPSLSGWAAFIDVPAAQRVFYKPPARLCACHPTASWGQRGLMARPHVAAAHPCPVWDPGDSVTRQRRRRWGQDVLAQPLLPP